MSARKRKTVPGSIFEENGRWTLAVRINNEVDKRGNPKYTKIRTGLPATTANIRLVEEKRDAIHREGFLPKPKESRTIRIQEAWELFTQTKDLLPKTLTNYQLAFEVIVRKQNYQMTVENLEDDLLHFKNRTARERGYSPVTINTYLRQFQVFLNFCTEKGFIPQTKFKSQFQRREPKPDVQIFSEEELALLLNEVLSTDREFGLMCSLMVETGARPVDVLNLLRRDVDVAKGIICWRNKITKIEEPTPISAHAQQIIAEALALAGEREKVFRWQHSSLSPLTDKLNAAMERCGIEKHGRSFKHFRTTFKYKIRHLPFEFQMRLMRHSTPDVTLGHYTAYNTKELQEKLNQTLAISA